MFAKMIVISFYILLLSACATQPLSVTSEPQQAEIVAFTREGNEINLGQTPLNLKPEDLDKMPSDLIRIGINKSGFVKEQIFIDKKWFSKSGSISIKLTPLVNWSEAYQDSSAYKYLNDVGSLTAEIQSATVKGDYGKAETLGKSLVTRYPKLAVGWSLLGNIYYLQKRMSDALSSYEKALNLNPDSQDIKNVINKIRGVGL